MDDGSLDWRPAARRVAEAWRFVVTLGILAGLASLALSLVLDEPYEAEALVAVTKPAVIAQFDDRLGERQLDPSFPYEVATLRAYAELAGAEAVARDAAERLGSPAPDAAGLRGRVKALARADGSLLVIRARARTAAAAADLANAWAEALIERAAQVYGGRLAAGEVVIQRREAEKALAQAEANLAAFHHGSALAAKEVELEDQKRAYSKALEFQDRLRAVLADIDTLREQAPAGAAATTGDALAALSVQLRTLSAEAPLPLNLQLDAAGVSSRLDGSAIDALQSSAAAASSALSPHLLAAAGRIQATNYEVEELRAERDALVRVRDLAEERFVALQRKTSELELSRAASGTELQMASAAEAPGAPDWVTPLTRALLAALLGSLVGVVLVLAFPVRFQRWSTDKDIEG